eukprot:tig00000802_g4272.t1
MRPQMGRSRIGTRVGVLIFLAAGVVLYSVATSRLNLGALERLRRRARPASAFAGGPEESPIVETESSSSSAQAGVSGLFEEAAAASEAAEVDPGESATAQSGDEAPAKPGSTEKGEPASGHAAAKPVKHASAKNQIVAGTKPIALAMAFNLKPKPHLIPIAQRSVQNKELYARLHGYSFILDPPDEIDMKRPPAWHKVLEVRRNLDHFEWVCWFDVDTVIANLEIKIEDLVGDGTRELVVAKTFEFFDIGEETFARSAPAPASDAGRRAAKQQEHRLNSGVYCMRNSSWSRMFLDRVYAEEKLINHANWEQRAMQVLLRDNPEWLEHVLYRDEHEMNVHNWQYKPGDFVVHFYGWNCQPKKCEVDIRERLDALLEQERKGHPEEVAASVAGLNLIAATYPELTIEELRKEAEARDRAERERKEAEERAKAEKEGKEKEGKQGRRRALALPPDDHSVCF